MATQAQGPIAVVGASGRLGRLLLRAGLAPALPQSRNGAVPGAACFEPLADPAAFAALARRASAVLMVAGPAAGTAAALAVHADLALAAIDAAGSAGVPVLIASSAAVYGATAGLLDEATPPAPVSDYGRAKLAMERAALRAAARPGAPPVVILRIGNVVGADALLGPGALPAPMLDIFADGGSPRRSWIGPRVLAQVIAGLAARAAGGGLPQVLNVAQPGTLPMAALLDAAGRAWHPRPAPASAIAEVALDPARLMAILPLPAASPAGLVADLRAVRP